jgi:hypothetical protein
MSLEMWPDEVARNSGPLDRAFPTLCNLELAGSTGLANIYP